MSITNPTECAVCGRPVRTPARARTCTTCRALSTGERHAIAQARRGSTNYIPAADAHRH